MGFPYSTAACVAPNNGPQVAVFTSVALHFPTTAGLSLAGVTAEFLLSDSTDVRYPGNEVGLPRARGPRPRAVAPVSYRIGLHGAWFSQVILRVSAIRCPVPKYALCRTLAPCAHILSSGRGTRASASFEGNISGLFTGTASA